jgi:DNA-binding transcriptional regulator YiaG
MSIAIAEQGYRSVDAIRSALVEQKLRAMPGRGADAVRYRRSLGLSQAAMARRLGVSASFWQQVELGAKRLPDRLREMLRGMSA